MSRPSPLTSRLGVIAFALSAAMGVAYVCLDSPESEPTTTAGPASDDGAARFDTPPAPLAGQDHRSDPLAQAVQLFHIGYAGGLQLDEETRAALDTLVNSLPEVPTAADLAQVEKALRLSLPHEDAERALTLVHGYIGYRADVSGLLAAAPPPANADELHQLFAQVDAIQRRHFTPDAEQALFGPGAREGRALLEIMTVQQDATLTDAQKQERINALRKDMPQAASAASASIP